MTPPLYIALRFLSHRKRAFFLSLGGVVFGRGEGGVWGPFFGVLCFAFLFVVMTMLGVGDAGKLVAQGLIILFAAIFYGLRTGK